MNQSYLSISWKQYHLLIQKLADAILTARRQKPDEIIAIGRGGLSVGLILSDFLRIPVSTITIQSYTGIGTQESLRLTETIGKNIQKKHILLVDDNADTGKTFLAAIKYLNTQHPATITTASVFYKPWSTYRPDFFSQETKEWILFPHEVTEWIVTFSKTMKEEGKTEKHITEFLQSLGYTRSQIRFARTHYDK